MNAPLQILTQMWLPVIIIDGVTQGGDERRIHPHLLYYVTRLQGEVCDYR